MVGEKSVLGDLRDIADVDCNVNATVYRENVVVSTITTGETCINIVDGASSGETRPRANVVHAIANVEGVGLRRPP